jgi:glycosyltransferase involved in cell wall biosynthesis
VIDAMALRVPPIAFAVGGLTELIVDGESGVLVPLGDTEAFARAATDLISDEGNRHRLGECGQTRATFFSVDRMVAGTEATYRRVIAS